MTVLLQKAAPTSVSSSSGRVPGPIYKGLAVLTLTSVAFAPALDMPWSSTPAADARQMPRASFDDVTAGIAANIEVVTDAIPPVVGTVSGLRVVSGLTADQIARLFGVSRRTIQNWVAGGAMASGHEERLAHLYAVVLANGQTPEERRKKLLSSAGGMSIFHQLIGELQRGAVLEPPAVSARDVLGV